MKYEGKTVVITGGSSGIGLTTAKLLVNGGARVLITGRDPAKLDSARRELGTDTLTVQSDAASVADIEALATQVNAAFGDVDGLFVNAGIGDFTPFEDTDEQLYDRLLDINAKGPYFTVQRLAPMLTAGSGVVLTTSTANVLGMPMLSAYSASKAALRSMARSMARELLPRGIRVNAVSPGPIDTGVLDKSMSAEAAEHTKTQMTEENPMLRFGAPVEVARAVAYLLFDATYTTGAELPVDGGGSQL